ncbi:MULTISPECIES: hypothetical protein [unclassified Microbacterium]|uniref:amidohydrolase family protein n=1 Tax=unclassified Microbacterium TaxID=2609290 RepID=UPI00214BA904|nr:MULTISPECIES: hypothetical protein [unclassified Microbacterium]MCR2808161.1 hypothetical protein [Microbacterium sp. zg.B185]WIM19373.1 hypothetical protein QNO12_00750 [Microbacterium sp. zg-B185]
MTNHELRGLLGEDVGLCRRAITGETGVLLPPFMDHHVHLHLIDEQRLGRHGIAGVLDLGGDPVQLARRPAHLMPRVAYAGAFLTVPGGYPVGRSWAPAGAVREVRDASAHPGVGGGATTAVDEQAQFGASVIKVSLNAAAGPVMDAATLATIIATARALALPVVAHAEGPGMVRLAIDAGVDALAHTPFGERLEPGLVTAAAALGQRWISTLDIHRSGAAERDRARGNLELFLAAGGTVLYGTDLGNGDLPVGVNPRELAALHDAGLRGRALLGALSDPWPGSERSHAVATFIPGDPPATLSAVPAWLAGSIVVPTEELIADEHG